MPYDQGKAPVELLAGRIDAARAVAGTVHLACRSGHHQHPVRDQQGTHLGPARRSDLCAEGGADDVDITMWRGLAAPADTPDEVIAVLEEAAQKAANER